MKDYNIADFQDISGIELTECQIAQYDKAEKRAIHFLENELGWTFDYEQLFFEKGKVKNVCSCPKKLKKLDESTLLPPDEVKGKVKLFHYDKKLSSIPIDPAKKIYSVKLVVPMTGTDEYITVKELENIMPLTYSHLNNFVTTIERCDSWPTTLCGCDCPGCGMLAVDADWLDKLSGPALEIFTELVIFFMKHPYSLDVSPTIKSESVDGHSVSYEKTETIDNIIQSKVYTDFIKKYMGPFSPYYTKVRLY